MRPSFEARKKGRAPAGERNCVHPGDDGVHVGSYTVQQRVNATASSA
jgi:hypothetical protein